jgi:putative oxidoreductase
MGKKEADMSLSDGEPRLIVPALAPVYRLLSPLAWPLIRVTCGLMLLSHGWLKIFVDPHFPGDTAALIAKIGMAPAVPLAWFIGLLETVGAVLLTIGLFTRPVALMISVEMLIITFGLMIANGRPYESTLMWGLVALAIAWRGGGPFSLDRVIAREF